MPKADPWEVYDELPAPIRAVLQEGPSDLCPLSARRGLRRWLRFNRHCADDGDTATDVYAESVADTVKGLQKAHRLEIISAEPWQPPGWGKRKPLPSLQSLLRRRCR
jgi:hypothetical protein